MAVKPISQILSEGLISSPSSEYEVEDLLGCGAFGVVAQCKKLATNETVALKILQSWQSTEEAEKEEATLKMMKEFDSDTFNIVRWNESFVWECYYCLEFEKLDISLHEFLQRKPLQLKEIRPIMEQLALALEFLKVVGIIHADLKPENIMMVDHIRKPLCVKVIDFGLAVSDPDTLRGMTLQTLWYRAPEILLGAPFNEAIDIWSLGCIAAEMLLGSALFPGSDEYDMVRQIVHTIGIPPDYLLDAGMHTELFFSNDGLNPVPRRRMASLKVKSFASAPCPITGLDDLLKIKQTGNVWGKEADEVDYDLLSFVDLLKQMLTVGVHERITPVHVLQHPFITMNHLTNTPNTSLNLESSNELMNICDSVNSDDWRDQRAFSSPVSPNEDNSLDHFPRATVITGGNSRKRMTRDDPDDADAAAADECGLSPNTYQAKRRRTQCQTTALSKPSVQKSPTQSASHKRKWGEDDRCVISVHISPTERKSSINLDEELTQSVKKLHICTEGAQYISPEPDLLRKRKRDDAEASGSTKCSGKRRRRGSPVRGQCSS